MSKGDNMVVFGRYSGIPELGWVELTKEEFEMVMAEAITTNYSLMIQCEKYANTKHRPDLSYKLFEKVSIAPYTLLKAKLDKKINQLATGGRA